MPKWLIFYDDRDPYSGLPEVAPERGVQAVIQEDETTGWYAITGHDFYVWLGTEWQGVDHFGLWDYLASPGWKRVLFGRMIKAERYEEIQKAALSVMGQKSAYRRGERK